MCRPISILVSSIFSCRLSSKDTYSMLYEHSMLLLHAVLIERRLFSSAGGGSSPQRNKKL